MSLDPLVRLAVDSYTHFLSAGKLLPRPPGLPEDLLATRAGAFVTLHKHGRLRGCIGTIEPAMPCLADEIIHNAVSAAFRDPRFPRLTQAELNDITCSVDVLGPAEDIRGLAQLDPQVYGVIVSSGFRRGLLLPMLEGVDTAEEQVDIARRKAGISDREPFSLQRFRVVRHT